MTKQNSLALKIIYSLVISILFLFSTSCTQDKYSKLVKEEMAKNIIHDSLLFGMRFGQSKQDFFKTCWELNKEGIIKQGPNNKFVEYKLPLTKSQDKTDAITMLFYGIFNNEDTMIGMDFQFYYNSWSLWNKEMQSDYLIKSVKDSLKTWYPGNDFIKLISKKDSSDYFIKIDGNRRITINPLNDNRIVKAQIDDLRYTFEK